MRDRLPTFEHYFSGGSIAFGLGLITNVVLGSLAIDVLGPLDQLAKSLVSIPPYFVFAVVGARLACRRITEKFGKAGLFIGLTAFLMHFGVNILFGMFTGGLWIFLSYMIGATIGARLAQRRINTNLVK
jgi:hypothetical protein